MPIYILQLAKDIFFFKKTDICGTQYKITPSKEKTKTLLGQSFVNCLTRQQL